MATLHIRRRLSASLLQNRRVSRRTTFIRDDALPILWSHQESASGPIWISRSPLLQANAPTGGRRPGRCSRSEIETLFHRPSTLKPRRIRYNT